MSGLLVMFGQDVELSNAPKHPDSIVDLIDTGDPLRPLRQPVSERPLFEALATGDAVPLSDAERDRVKLFGIALQDVTGEVRERTLRQALADGVPRDLVNAMPATRPHYRPARPVRFTGSFVPVRKSY